MNFQSTRWDGLHQIYITSKVMRITKQSSTWPTAFVFVQFLIWWRKMFFVLNRHQPSYHAAGIFQFMNKVQIRSSPLLFFDEGGGGDPLARTFEPLCSSPLAPIASPPAADRVHESEMCCSAMCAPLGRETMF